MSDVPSTSTPNEAPYNPAEPADSEHQNGAPDTASGVSPDAGKEKRGDQLRGLLSKLDAVTYIELAGLYYLDTSTALFLFRSIQQSYHITIPWLSQIGSASRSKSRRPSAVVLFLSNIIFTLIHLFSDAPSASETTRYYLHGGLFVDLIGQRAKGTWHEKMALLILDVLVVTAQILACSVLTEIQRQGTWRLPNRIRGAGESTAVENQQTDINDEGIELVDRGGDTWIRLLDSQQHGNALLHDTSGPSQTLSRAMAGFFRLDGSSADRESTLVTLETVYAAQVVIANLYVWDTIRNSFWDERNIRRGGRV